MQNKLFECQKMQILEMAEKESCIIVGRCADYILSDRKDVFRIFIYAPEEERIKYGTHELGLSEDEAAKTMHQVDRERRLYHEFYTSQNYQDLHHYDLMIDSSFLGVDKTAQFISDMVRARFQ